MSSPNVETSKFYGIKDFENIWRERGESIPFIDAWRLLWLVIGHRGVSGELLRLEEEIDDAFSLVLTDRMRDWEEGVPDLLIRYEAFLRKVGELAFGIDEWNQRVRGTRRSHRRPQDSESKTSLFDVLLALNVIDRSYLVGEKLPAEGAPGFAHEVCLVYRHRNEEGHAAPELTGHKVHKLREAIILAYVHAVCVQWGALEQRFASESFLPWRHYLEKLPERLARLQRQGVVDIDILEEHIPDASLLENLWDVPQSPGDLAKSESLEPRRGTFNELASQTGRFLLLGEPGGGKTTALVHWAVQRAKALRDGYVDNPRIPLYIGLRSYAPSVRLRGMIADTLKSLGGDASGISVEAFMRCEHALLLLDGLNEIGDNYREDALREIEDLLQPEVFAGHVVVTGRMQPDHVLRRLKLPVFHVQRLSDRQIEEFIHKRSLSQEDARQFLARLKQTPAFWSWGRTPFVLSMLAIVGGSTGAGIPNNRADLISRFLATTLDRDLQKDCRQTQKKTKLTLLGQLAHATRSSGRVAFSRGEGERMVGEFADKIGEHLASRRAFIDEVVDNNLLAYNDETDELRFVHEVFQEFFAAAWIFSQSDVFSLLDEALLASEFWEESLALLYDMLRGQRDSRAEKLVVLLSRTNLPLAGRCVGAAGAEGENHRGVIKAAIDALPIDIAPDLQRRSAIFALFSLGDVEHSGEVLCRWDDVSQKGYRKNVARASLQRVVREAIGRVRQPLEFSLKLADWIFQHRRPLLACYSVPLLESVSTELSDANEYRGPGAEVCHHLVRALVDSNRATVALGWHRRLGDADSKFSEDMIRRMIDRADFLGATKWMLAYRGMLPELPEAIATELMESGQWPAATNWVIDLQLQAVVKKAKFVSHLLALGKAEQALRIIHEFNLQTEFSADTLIEELLAQMQYDAALKAVKRFPGVCRYSCVDIVRQMLLRPGMGVEALRVIRELGLEQEFPDSQLLDCFRTGRDYVAEWTMLRSADSADQAALVKCAGHLVESGREDLVLDEIRTHGGSAITPDAAARVLVAHQRDAVAYKVATEFCESVPGIAQDVAEGIFRRRPDLALALADTCGFQPPWELRCGSGGAKEKGKAEIPASAFSGLLWRSRARAWETARRYGCREIQESLVKKAISLGYLDHARNWAAEVGIDLRELLIRTAFERQREGSIKKAIRLLQAVLPDAEAEALIQQWSHSAVLTRGERILEAITSTSPLIANALRAAPVAVSPKDTQKIAKLLVGKKSSMNTLELLRSLSEAKVMTAEVWQQFADVIDVPWRGALPTSADLGDERKRGVAERWLDARLYRLKIVAVNSGFGFAGSRFFPGNVYFQPWRLRLRTPPVKGEWILAWVGVQLDLGKNRWGFVVKGGFMMDQSQS